MQNGTMNERTTIGDVFIYDKNLLPRYWTNGYISIDPIYVRDWCKNSVTLDYDHAISQRNIIGRPHHVTIRNFIGGDTELVEYFKRSYGKYSIYSEVIKNYVDVINV